MWSGSGRRWPYTGCDTARVSKNRGESQGVIIHAPAAIVHVVIVGDIETVSTDEYGSQKFLSVPNWGFFARKKQPVETKPKQPVEPQAGPWARRSGASCCTAALGAGFYCWHAQACSLLHCV